MKLVPGHWYGWQMIPGYGNSPYFSPIRLEAISEPPSRKGKLDIRFFNAFYASGVQIFEKKLSILYRSDRYIVARMDDGAMARIAIVSEITTDWLEQCCPRVADALREDNGQGDLNDRLSELR